MSKPLPADYVPRAHMRVAETDLAPFKHEEYLSLVRPLHVDASELGPVTRWELQDADWLHNMMRRMGLAAYHHSHANLIGFADANAQHPHDRWLYRVMAKSWYRLSSENHPGSGGVGVPDLKNSVQELWENLEFAYGTGAPDKVIEAGLRTLHLFGLEEHQSSAAVSQRLRCKPAADMHEVHELLYHRQAWRRKHPEVAALPIELVLRMHGLGPLLDEDRRLQREDYSLPDLRTWGLEEDPGC